MLVVETIAKIRRAFFVDGKSIKQICRDLRLSRNTVRKVIRSGDTEFSYDRSVQPRPKIDPWRDRLDGMLEDNAGKPRRDRLTLVRIYEDLRNPGYDGSYDAVRRYAANWSREFREASAAAYVPLSFDPGEAYQSDRSHEVVLIDGVTTTVKVAHVRLSHSRTPFVRAYPRETQVPLVTLLRNALPVSGWSSMRMTRRSLSLAVPVRGVSMTARFGRHGSGARPGEDRRRYDLRRQRPGLQSTFPADVRTLSGRSAVHWARTNGASMNGPAPRRRAGNEPLSAIGPGTMAGARSTTRWA